MLRNKVLISLLLLSSLFAKEIIAVLDLEQIGLSPQEATILTQRLTTELISLDKYGKVAEKYGVKSLPRLVVIDQKSKVHYIHDGYAPGDEKKLKEVLDKLTDAKK